MEYVLCYVSSGSDVTDVSGLAVPVIIVGLLLCIVTVTVIVLLQGPRAYAQSGEDHDMFACSR